MSLRVRFVADQSFVSRTIGWFGGGIWSHMATYISDDIVIDSRMDIIQGILPGVRERPIEYLDRYKQWLTLEIPCTEVQEAACITALRSQLGKPYDKIGIWNFATGSMDDTNWRDLSAWFCDALAIWAQEVAGICPFLTLPAVRLTPSTAFLIDQALGGKVIASKGM